MLQVGKIIRVLFPLLIFLLAWQLLSIVNIINPEFLPSPVNVGSEFIQLIFNNNFVADIVASIQRVLIGFAIASVVGIGSGLLLGMNKKLSNFFMPILEVLRPIPPIAWIPLAILWFGLGDKPAYFLVTLGAFFPIFTNTYFGIISLKDTYRRAALCLGATKTRFISEVLIPSSLPHIFAGLKIGLGVGWMAVITAELVGAQSGLGYMIQINRLLLETPRVIVGMAVIGLLGFLMNKSMIIVEGKLIPWKLN
jgi:ABC-type nitrate/sulfonate/bicarbonate transport system permease component